MKHLFAIALAVSAMSVLSACDDGGKVSAEDAAKAQAAAAAKKAAAAKAEADREAALEAEKAKLMGMSTPYASLEDWNAGCVAADVDAKICKCAGDVTVKQLGEKALYTWVWEGYILRQGMGQTRSTKFFVDAGLTDKDRQAYADAVAKCYVY